MAPVWGVHAVVNRFLLGHELLQAVATPEFTAGPRQEEAGASGGALGAGRASCPLVNHGEWSPCRDDRGPKGLHFGTSPSGVPSLDPMVSRSPCRALQGRC